MKTKTTWSNRSEILRRCGRYETYVDAVDGVGGSVSMFESIFYGKYGGEMVDWVSKLDIFEPNKYEMLEYH